MSQTRAVGGGRGEHRRTHGWDEEKDRQDEDNDIAIGFVRTMHSRCKHCVLCTLYPVCITLTRRGHVRQSVFESQDVSVGIQAYCPLLHSKTANYSVEGEMLFKGKARAP